jgi:predicted aspartyl protease
MGGPVRVGIVCLVTLLGSVESPTAAVGAAATPFEFGAHREPIVQVRINGQGPFPFVLDTGSTHSVIGDRLADILQLPVVAKAPMATAVGETMRPVVRLDRLGIGPIVSSDLLATAVDDATLDPDSAVMGIVGQDVLADLVYSLDFVAHQIEWDARTPSPSSHASTLTLRDVRGRFLAELPQQDSTLWLVPDSGAEALVLYERPAVQLPPLTRRQEVEWLSTLSAGQAVETARVNRLRVGRANLTDVPAVLVRRSDADPAFGDGLLPLAMFARVTLDGPRRRMIIEP